MPNKPKLVDRVCELCGSKFTNLAKIPAKYCSHTCRGKASRLFDGEAYFRVVSKRRNGTQIKKRYLELGNEELCAECGIGPVWNDKPLTLEVDHISGNPCDDRLLNLRLLCPNCHSQTDTFRAKNRGRVVVPVEKPGGGGVDKVCPGC